MGALLDKNAIGKGRPWERQVVRTTCPYCGVGCRIDLHVKGGKIIKSMGARAIPNEGRLCVKGRFGLGFVDHPERLKTPMIKKNGHFQEATWDEALDLVAAKFKEVKEKHRPKKMGGWCSARITNEDNYVFQKFMRAHGGDEQRRPLRPSLTRSTVAGLAATFGSGAMTNPSTIWQTRIVSW